MFLSLLANGCSSIFTGFFIWHRLGGGVKKCSAIIPFFAGFNEYLLSSPLFLGTQRAAVFVCFFTTIDKFQYELFPMDPLLRIKIDDNIDVFLIIVTLNMVDFFHSLPPHKREAKTKSNPCLPCSHPHSFRFADKSLPSWPQLLEIIDYASMDHKNGSDRTELPWEQLIFEVPWKAGEWLGTSWRLSACDPIIKSP